jgi:hypothetical protein
MTIHTVFDLLAWVSGTLLGLFVKRRYLAEMPAVFRVSAHPGYVIAVALCAGIGAYLAGGGNMALAGLPPLGHSVAGAIAGGILGAEAYKTWRGIKGSTGLVFVAPLAAGIAVGRWGCFLAGLPDYTYGTPTMLPWGVDFGDGIPRHPVQLYESVAMAAFLAGFLLMLERNRRRLIPSPLAGEDYAALARPQGKPTRSWVRGRSVSNGSESPSPAIRASFYLLVGFYALQRFAWEFIKPYPRVVGPFDIFHFLMAGLFAYSVLMLWGERRRHESAGDT